VRKPYDWDCRLGDESFWDEPIGAAERAFWRGVLVGGLIEAVFVLLAVLVIVWWVS